MANNVGADRSTFEDNHASEEQRGLSDEHAVAFAQHDEEQPENLDQQPRSEAKTERTNDAVSNKGDIDLKSLLTSILGDIWTDSFDPLAKHLSQAPGWQDFVAKEGPEILQKTQDENCYKWRTHPNIQNINPDGDVFVGIGEIGPTAICYLVSSHAMSMACQPWRTMLDKSRGFKESRRMTVEFQFDDAAAMTVILQIVHLQFDIIPTNLTLLEMYNIAILCDKYFLHSTTAYLSRMSLDLVEPPVDWFTMAWLHAAKDPRFFVYITEKLTVAKVFRRPEWAEIWAYIMVTHAHCDANGELSFDGVTVVAIAPGEILKHIANARHWLVDSLCEKETDWFERLHKRNQCPTRTQRHGVKPLYGEKRAAYRARLLAAEAARGEPGRLVSQERFLGENQYHAQMCDPSTYGVVSKRLNMVSLYPAAGKIAHGNDMNASFLSKVHQDILDEILAFPENFAGNCNHWFAFDSVIEYLKKSYGWDEFVETLAHDYDASKAKQM